VVAHRFCSPFRELLVVVVATHAVSMTFDREAQAGIGQYNARNFGQALACSGKKFEAAALEEHVRHVGDQAASRITGREHGVELLQESCAQFLFLFFGLLAHLFGLRGGLACLVGFGRKSLLLCQGFRFRLLRFLFLPGCFLCRLQCLGFGSFGLGAGGLGFGSSSWLGFRIGASFGGTLVRSSLF